MCGTPLQLANRKQNVSFTCNVCQGLEGDDLTCDILINLVIVITLHPYVTSSVIFLTADPVVGGVFGGLFV